MTIQPTLTPLRRKQSFYGSVRLTSVEYNDKLAYENSLEYEELSTRFEMAVSTLCFHVTDNRKKKANNFRGDFFYFFLIERINKMLLE